MNARRILHVLGYSAWFAFVFAVLTWVTFPWSKVRDQAIVGAHGAGMVLKLDSLRAGPFGATAKGLSLAPRSKDGEPKAAWIQADKVKLKTGPIAEVKAALEGRKIASEGRVKTGELVQRLIAAMGSAALDADMYDGTTSIDVDGDGDGKAARFQIEMDGLNMAKYPIRAGMFEADPTGALNSNIDVIWNWEDPRKTSGDADIEFSNLVLAGFKASGFAIPEATFDRSEIHLKFKSGKAEFRDTSFESETASAELGGFVTLKKRVMRSTLSLNLKFKVRKDLDNLLKLAVGKNARHRDDDGWYHYQVLGNLARPKLRPSPLGTRKPASKPRSLPPQVNDEDDDEDDDEPDPVQSRVRDRRNRALNDAVERPQVDDDRRRELEERRARLREERRERRERQREARRKKALERAAEIDPSTLEDIEPILPSDDIERTNEPDDLEIEGDFNEGDGDFEGEDGGDVDPGGDVEPDGDYQD